MYIYIYIYIYTHFGEGINGCYCRNANSSNELSISLANCLNCIQTKTDIRALNSRADVDSQKTKRVCHRRDVKLGRFRSRFEVPCPSRHTEVF